MYGKLFTVGSSSKNDPVRLSTTDMRTFPQKLAQKKSIPLNWQTSIVDLLKLLELDSSQSSRKLLTQNSKIFVGVDGSAEGNIALHRAMIEELAKTVSAQIEDAGKLVYKAFLLKHINEIYW